MPTRSGGRDQRRAPRIDVLLRIRGHLVSLDAPIVVHNLSRSGFAVLSETPFTSGETLDFQLTAEDGSTAYVTAEAVHTQPLPQASNLYLSGFKFVPGALTGLVPQVIIDRLIDAVATPGLTFFTKD
jgi:hypothetical protein